MKPFLFPILLFSSTGLLMGQEISYLGVNKTGNEVAGTLNAKAYERHMTASLKILDATLEQNFSESNPQFQKKFKLSSIVIGIGATGEVGIGPYKIGAGIKQRAVFKRPL